MNIFSIIILIALILNFTLGLVANLLNLKVLRLELSPGLDGVYTQGDYRKSQEYTRVTTHFGIVHTIFNLVILLAFWFSRGFNYFDQVIRARQFVPLVNGLLYTGILLLIYSLIDLTFNVYSTFVSELLSSASPSTDSCNPERKTR